jgi:RNA polymerase sigma factor (TIGR02999 family)
VNPAADVTTLLLAHGRGEAGAFDALVPLVYADLRRLARVQRRRLPAGDTLDTTGLVHEAYARLVDAARVSWNDRGHFLAVAAKVMRHILVDYARTRGRLKRGGNQRMETLDEDMLAVARDAERLLDIDRALERLVHVDPRLVRLVECRFFAGLSEQETADALGLSLRTVQRDWLRARAALRRELSATTT